MPSKEYWPHIVVPKKTKLRVIKNALKRKEPQHQYLEEAMDALEAVDQLNKEAPE